MNIKRIIISAFAVVMALTFVIALASCGNGSKPSEEQTTTENASPDQPESGDEIAGEYYESEEVVFPEIPME